MNLAKRSLKSCVGSTKIRSSMHWSGDLQSSLIAMKVLSSTNKHRRQDLLDLDNLISDSKKLEIEQAMDLIKMIEERGFNQGENLIERFNQLLKEALD